VPRFSGVDSGRGVSQKYPSFVKQFTVGMCK
jgi:hypothetical protein